MQVRFNLNQLATAVLILGLTFGAWSMGLRHGRSTFPATHIHPLDELGMGDICFEVASFRIDVEACIRERRFRDALALLLSADVDAIARNYPRSYCAVSTYDESGFSIHVLPGEDSIVFDRERDWLIPDTVSDCLLWTELSEIFAAKVNARISKSKTSHEPSG